MKTHCNRLLLALALAGTAGIAHGAQADIKVWADVDTTLALLKADGSPLPDVVELVHRPGQGLARWSEQVRIFSNDISKDVEVRLTDNVLLRPVVAAAGAVDVPLTVRLNGRALTPAAQDFAAGDLFNGALPGASIAMPLAVEQTILAPIQAAGLYEGMVSVVVAQKAGNP